MWGCFTAQRLGAGAGHGRDNTDTQLGVITIGFRNENSFGIFNKSGSEVLWK